jgi:putative ABC transport system permease protein
MPARVSNNKPMKLFAYLRQLLSTLFDRPQSDRELDEELLTHIEQHADDLQRSGLSRQDAERRARIAFGAYEKAKENVREQRPGFWFETFWSDIRFALRMLGKNPAFSSIAILTLALGIGANTAIFSVVDAVLLRPLPYSQPDRLVTVSESNRPYDLLTRNAVAPGNFLDWRDRNHVFEQIAAVQLPGFSLTGLDRPERVLGAATSAGMLRLLGLRPALGREFEAADDHNGAAPVVMLTHALWKRRFAADPDILGKTIHLGMTPYTVIGVLPAGLKFPEPDVQLWVPLEQGLSPQEMHWHSSHYLDVYARLKPGVTLAQANEQISRIAAEVKQENPDSNSGAAALVISMQEDLAGTIRPALITLLVAVAFVLLIACANVANLLLVRAAGRGKELAIRMALGAGKSRVLRQMLTESVFLSVAGGCAGLFVASWTRQALLALKPESLPQFNVIQTDWRVLLFTLAISILTGLLFGLVPALRGTGLNLAPTLHGSSRTVTANKNTQHLRNIFVSAEMAISLVLLVGAGLTIRSFLELRNIPLGFRTDHTVTARISIPEDKYSGDDQVVSFYDSVLERIRATPGVESAGLISFLPLTGHNFDNSFDIVGRPPRPASGRDYALVRFVDPQFFDVLQIPLLSGRSLEPRDRAGSSRSIVLSESMAKRYWPNASSGAVGAHLTVYLGMDQSPWEVVGIVGDVRTSIAEEPQPTMYFPYSQIPFRFMVLAVRTHGDAKAMSETIRKTVSQLDPDQPVFQSRTLADLVDQSLIPWRFSMTLLAAFAAMALLLAAAGIYGVMSYTVGQRTQEMGVRMALGAQPADVLRLVIAQGAKLAFVGVLIGLLVSLGVTRLMSKLLFGVSTKDPFTLSAVALLLALVALVACYIPARRATRVDPTIALRCE